MRRLIVSSIFFMFLFSGCVMCDIYKNLDNKTHDYDYCNVTDKDHNFFLQFEITTRNQDVFSSNISYPRLLYVFGVHTPKLPFIRLNSFSFSKGKNGADTIPFRAYMYTYQQRTPIPIDIPFTLPDSLQGKSASLEIVMESSESYHETKKLYVSYDIEAELDDDTLYGKVLGLDKGTLVTYEGKTLAELKEDFINAVEDYIASCKEKGLPLHKSYTGSFNIRIPIELHAKAAAKAQEEGISLNAFVKESLMQAVI